MSSSASLFKPVQLGPLALKNAIVMAPMTRSFSPGGVPNQLVIDYYRRRAENEVGLIITEGTVVNHEGASGYPNVPQFYGQGLDGWKEVVDAVHAAGGKIAPQLWHVGNVRRKGVEPFPEAPAYGPSGLEKNGQLIIKEMSQTDIDEVVAAFAQAAADAKAIGFDAIELHGAHGYLIDQFFWEGSNKRTDSYGGDLEARSKFAREVIAACRVAVGPEFPIIFRWSQWKQQDYTARLCETPEALQAFLQGLVDAGADILHCSTRRFWVEEFEGSNLNLAGWAKKLVDVPVITVGSVGLNSDFLEYMIENDSTAETHGVDELCERLDAGEFDAVAVGRALIADPEWATKLRDGRFDEIVGFNREQLKSLV